MSRKDYVAIAETLRYQLDAHLGQVEVNHANGVADAAKALATTFGNDNPNFDREKFLYAAGVTDPSFAYAMIG